MIYPWAINLYQALNILVLGPAQPVRKWRSKGWCAKELASPQTAPEVRGRWTCAHCCATSLHRLLLQKSTSPCEDSEAEKKTRKDIAIEKLNFREREHKHNQANQNTTRQKEIIEKKKLKGPLVGRQDVIPHCLAHDILRRAQQTGELVRIGVDVHQSRRLPVYDLPLMSDPPPVYYRWRVPPTPVPPMPRLVHLAGGGVWLAEYSGCRRGLMSRLVPLLALDLSPAPLAPRTLRVRRSIVRHWRGPGRYRWLGGWRVIIEERGGSFRPKLNLPVLIREFLGCRKVLFVEHRLYDTQNREKRTQCHWSSSR